jgi:steroid delta-isomerase-like uncharacterized protein
MSAEENKALVRRWVEEVVNKHSLAAIDELVDPNAVDHAALPGQPQGIEGIRQFFRGFFTAFPDLQATVEDIIAEGDKVVARSTARGTHRGEFLGLAPTGRQITVSSIDIARLANGKQVEHWGQFDTLGLMQQLGAVPGPGQPMG